MSSRTASSRRHRWHGWHWFALAVSIVICFGAALVGQVFTVPGLGGWYESLNKPSWNPPSWIFGPLWSALFLSMAIAVWMVWREDDAKYRRTAIFLFAIQLSLNVLWTAIFFEMRSPGLAALEVAALWIAIAATTATFARVSRTAAYLMTPYLGWVTFAAALNVAVWRLNS